MTLNEHPQAIFIQLHTHCNAECINCPFEFTYNSIHKNGRMGDETWNKILSDLIEIDYKGQVGLYLHHEPLIDKTLYQKIEDINKKTNGYVVLSTNGQLLNDENIENLLRARPKKVHLNINSGNRAEYESSMKGLKYEITIKNCRNFIDEAKDVIDIEINCPVIEGFDVQSLKELFPDVKVNLDYWANSRGGLLPDFYKENKGSRFKVDNYCRQPSSNFNILFDGSTIACCMDWMHETKRDFPNVNDSSILEIYNEIKILEENFKIGDYSKYRMCDNCSKEMDFYRADAEGLKILVTNHHFLEYRGSELFTYNLIDYLISNNHEVTLFTKYIGDLKDLLEETSVRIVTDLEEISGEKFDIAHVHHNICALEVRYFFPNLPILFMSHGVIPFLEQPPEINIGIECYLAVSEEVQDNLQNCGIERNKIKIFRNKIDPKFFKMESKINETPQNALVISNKIDHEREKIIRSACSLLNIEVEFIGQRFKNVSPEIVVQKIIKCDIVFTLGRGVIETMMCGRIPIVYDVNGGDGMVSPENVSEYMKKNFSGRVNNKNFTIDELVNEINGYDHSNGEKLREIALDLFNFESFEELIDLYKEIIARDPQISCGKETFSVIESIINISKETIHYENLIHKKELAEVNLEYVEHLISVGNLVKAKEILLKDKDIPNLSVKNNLAVIAIMEERYSDAWDLIKEILIIDQFDEIAINNLQYLNTILNDKQFNFTTQADNNSILK